MKEVKTSLKNLKISSAEIRAVLPTKTDMERLTGEVRILGASLNGFANRVGLVETALTKLDSKVDSKLIGGGQMFAIFGGLMATFLALASAMVGLLHYLGWLR